MTDDKLTVPGVVLNGNQREFLAGLVRAQDHVTAADVEPPNHRLTVGARRHGGGDCRADIISVYAAGGICVR